MSPAAFLIECGSCLQFFLRSKAAGVERGSFEEDFLHFKSMWRRGPDFPFIGREIKQNESNFTPRAHSEKRRTRICLFVRVHLLSGMVARPLCFWRCIMQISMQLVQHDMREAHQEDLHF